MIGLSLLHLNVFVCQQPRMLPRGSLRWVVETGWASLIMHYTDMWSAGEATTVLVKLQEGTRRIWGGEVDAHSVLVAWGELIRAKFKTDNLPITCRLQHYPEMKHVVEIVSGLSSNYLALQQSAMASNARQQARDKMILQQQATIMEQNAKILEWMGAGAGLKIDKGKGAADSSILCPSSASRTPMSPQGDVRGGSGAYIHIYRKRYINT